MDLAGHKTDVSVSHRIIVNREIHMPQTNGSGFDLDTELRECQEIDSRISERLNRLVDGVQSGTAGVAIWSLDKLESDCRDLEARFKKIAAVLRIL